MCFCATGGQLLLTDALQPGAQPVFRVLAGPSSRQWLQAL